MIKEDIFNQQKKSITVSGAEKGFNLNLGEQPIETLYDSDESIFQGNFSFPLMILKNDAIKNNLEWMGQYLNKRKIQLAAHGKTSMAPQLHYRQLHDPSSWGLTLATVHQVKTAYSFGFRKILLANPLSGDAETDYILALLESDPDFSFYCLADSIENLEFLRTKLQTRKLRNPLNILIEFGAQGGRSGCRSAEGMFELAKFILQEKGTLHLAGVEGYEGVISGRNEDETIQKVRLFMDKLVDIAVDIYSEMVPDDEPLILSAGGTAYFDIVADSLLNSVERFNHRKVDIVIRSGCYITYDDSIYQEGFRKLKNRCSIARTIPFDITPAIEVWGRLISRPEAKLGIVQLGCRDVSFDHGLPVAMKYLKYGETVPNQLNGCRMVNLNDQHAYLEIQEENELQVGDLIGFGISHPCLTFDKWKYIPLIDGDYKVLDIYKTYF